MLYDERKFVQFLNDEVSGWNGDEIELSGLIQGTAERRRVAILKCPRRRPDIVRLTLDVTAARTGNVFGAFKVSEWWSNWASLLVDAMVLPPLADPFQLKNLLEDPRPLRCILDTNALAGATALWLHRICPKPVDFITSAVVDRELAAWPDRHPKFWQAKTTETWNLRTQYRRARRLIESPPTNTTIERLAPEQSALLLAKTRDEDPTKPKSPDADMLMIELAGSYMRTVPNAVQVVYVTGDRNNARAATGALGADKVLWVQADEKAAKRAARNQTFHPVGWWNPGGPLGSVVRPTLGEIAVSLLAGFQSLRLSDGTKEAVVHRALSIANGCPTDWARPWYEVKLTSLAPLLAPVSAPPVANPAPAPLVTAFSPPVQQPLIPAVTQAGPVDAVLLSVQDAPDDDLGADGHPLYSSVFFHLIQELREQGSIRRTLKDTETRVLLALKALGIVERNDGAWRRGGEFDACDKAWENNDHDAMHHILLRHKGYRKTMALMETGQRLDRKPAQTHAGLAQMLGQAVRVAARTYQRGDSGVDAQELLRFLDRMLPNVGTPISMDKICLEALNELHLSPFRLQRALDSLWSLGLPLPYETAAGGQSVRSALKADVVVFEDDGVRQQPVNPDVLRFGGNSAVRFLERVQ